jgi:uncharacterized phage protein (TIGR01671 family)
MPKKTNREIKFRFYAKKIGKTIDWELVLKECNRLSFLNHPDYIPLQFTGFLDKSGKEIYAGDILKQGSIEDKKLGYKAIVKWHDIDGSWIAEGFQLSVSLGSLMDKTGVSIIGNVYSNPELLGEKQ